MDPSLALKQKGLQMLVDNDIKDITTGNDSADLPGPEMSDTHHAGHTDLKTHLSH